jgi:hypothetical protein
MIIINDEIIDVYVEIIASIINSNLTFVLHARSIKSQHANDAIMH